MRIWALALVLVSACASRAPSQTLKAENKRLQNELADSRRHQAETDEKVAALQRQLAEIDQSTKAKDTEIAKLRTESSASSRDRADARVRADAANKRVPPVQCPVGTMLDATGTNCVPTVPPPVVSPPVTPPAPPMPVVARVLKISLDGDFVLVVLGAGTENGVAKTWRARFLRGATTTPLVGGRAEIVRVDRRTTTVKVKMLTDAIDANPTVELSPGGP